jgi:alanyl-tRNA synthetase
VWYNFYTMTALEIIDKYIAFFEKRGHKRIANSPLVPENDPTTLFTSSGMQPLVPYLLGEKHPMGKRLVNVQNSFRAQDIDEVGDNRHTTFFRMLGNWSLGDYFKKEQIPWIWEFATKELKIPANKLYATVFKGYKNIPKDIESEKIWTEIFTKEGLDPKERIFFYDTKNWWSRAGEPDKMPSGEPGGPDSEVFFQFDVPHNKKFGDKCHPNCDCGKFMEIINSVFMEYQKQADGSFKKLPQQNVDHGAGVERLLSAAENQNDIFKTNLFTPIAKAIENIAKKDYESNVRAIRIIIDHLVASVFIAANDIIPSNKEQGYILRRLLRRAIRYGKQLEINKAFTSEIASVIIRNYLNTDFYLAEKEELIKNLFNEEEIKFAQVIEEGLRRSEKIFATKTPINGSIYSKLMQIPDKKELFRDIYRNKTPKDISISIDEIKQATISGQEGFNLFQSFGFPIEMIIELVQEKGLLVDIESFEKEMEKHQKISRAGAEKKFAGGLADHSEKTVMGHTATHLLHKALRNMFGEKVRQAGSNITSERLRFDFAFDRNLTPEELKKTEETVNQKIKDNLPVNFEILLLEKAKQSGAIGIFNEKYSDKVKVYSIGDYSKEICGGPHVTFTSEIKSFKIIKQENIGKGNRRIYAKVG